MSNKSTIVALALLVLLASCACLGVMVDAMRIEQVQRMVMA